MSVCVCLYIYIYICMYICIVCILASCSDTSQSCDIITTHQKCCLFNASHIQIECEKHRSQTKKKYP